MKNTAPSLLLVSILLIGQVLAQQGGVCTPRGGPGPDPGAAVAIGIDFDPSNLVMDVFFTVPQPFLRPWIEGQVSLDITITSLNSGFRFHGTQVEPLSATNLITLSGPYAVVGVSWTTDTEPTHSGDTYTVSATLIDLATSTPLSARQDAEFGPY